MTCFRQFFLLCVLLLPGTVMAEKGQADIGYSTERLRGIAEKLRLSGLDRLAVGTHTATYSYKGYPLTIRINEWREIEHIGFWLFREETLRLENPLPVYDFIERYLLELKMPDELDPAMRLLVDKVDITGDIDAIFSFTGKELFEVQYVDFRKYLVSWHSPQNTLLTISFDMDYQLMAGCNALELEYNLLRDIRRFACTGITTDTLVVSPQMESNSNYYVDKREQYLIDLVRNDLYYFKHNNTYELLYDESKANQTIANIMLTPQAKGNFQLDIQMDLYGYKEANIHISLDQWLCYCKDKGCVPFFGIKSKNADSLLGTVFMVNKKGGYNHILSIEFPFANLSEGTGSIRARLFAYIPMHNLSDSFYLKN